MRVPRYPTAAGALEGGQTNPPDGFPEKLAKYVPAEVLAFYVPALGLTGVRTDHVALLLLTAVGVVGTVLYLVVAARKQPGSNAPVWFYALAALAFLGWAIGTVPEVAGLTGLSAGVVSLVLPISVFLIPGIDEAITTRS